jgi:hypothetical protein
MLVSMYVYGFPKIASKYQIFLIGFCFLRITNKTETFRDRVFTVLPSNVLSYGHNFLYNLHNCGLERGKEADMLHSRYNPAQPSSAQLTQLMPSPTQLSSAQLILLPSPAQLIPQPSPAQLIPQPSPAQLILRPSPAHAAAQFSQAHTAAQPSPAHSAAQPSPAHTAGQPSPAHTAAQPSPAQPSLYCSPAQPRIYRSPAQPGRPFWPGPV